MRATAWVTGRRAVFGVAVLAAVGAGTVVVAPWSGASAPVAPVAATMVARSSSPPASHRGPWHPRSTGRHPWPTRTTSTSRSVPVPTSTTSTTSTTAPVPTSTTTSAPVPTTATTTTSTTATTTTTATTATAAGAVENWAASSSSLFALAPRGGSSATPASGDTAASDGKALALTIPAGAKAGPAYAAEVESRKTYLYGSFASRVRTADCASQPRTGAVTGIFTYANDGADHNGDGIADNGELDVEILCARPWEVNLTIWTDYSETTQAQKRVSRVVDLRTGAVLSTCYKTSFDDGCGTVSAAENTPTALPASATFDSAAAYHDYRIDWSADRVVFTASVDGRDVTLWDYRGPSRRIPHTAASYLVNLWHTDDWTPTGTSSATAAPSARLTAWVDSSTITAAR